MKSQHTGNDKSWIKTILDTRRNAVLLYVQYVCFLMVAVSDEQLQNHRLNVKVLESSARYVIKIIEEYVFCIADLAAKTRVSRVPRPSRLSSMLMLRAQQ